MTRNIKTFFTFFLFVFIIFFLISSDSYTHDIWYRNDSAWFFLSGKAWMNGMVPYVDFADSKGPLLFLIYGIGYLISPHNYIGVFWISVFWYTIVFYTLFKLCLLFLKDRTLSFAASLLMALALFEPYHDNEFRAEDLCMPFFVISLYTLCKVLYTETYSLRKCCFVIGICLGATFLIKYSCTAMMAAFPLTGLVYLIREKKDILQSILYLFAGLIVTFLPFTIYMICTNSLDDFWNEYIVNTLKTVQGSANIKTSIMEVSYIFANPVRFTILSVGIFGCLAFSQTVSKYKYVPLVCFIYFMLIASKHTYLDKFSSYFMPAAIFFVFLNISFITLTKSLFENKYKIITTAFITIILVSTVNLLKYTCNTPLAPDFFIYNREFRKQYYDIAYLMSQINNPTYINWHEAQECGTGVPVNSLPGTKYWTLQAGYTDEMEAAQTEAVFSGAADFVIVANNENYTKYKNQLEKTGYRAYYEYEHPRLGGKQILFSKHNLKMPPKGYVISNWDVLIKRKLFN